jgi:lactate dehydrogenase-like 2-hydroxyacid dehydrogenase
LPNVIVQPHQGSATVETRTAIGQLMLDNLVAWFERRPLLSPVA